MCAGIISDEPPKKQLLAEEEPQPEAGAKHFLKKIRAVKQ
jgi:hypothetical protein